MDPNMKAQKTEKTNKRPSPDRSTNSRYVPVTTAPIRKPGDVGLEKLIGPGQLLD